METVRIPSQLNLETKDLGASWRKFRQNFEIYLQARGTKQCEDNKVALFLNIAGEDAVALANRLDLFPENNLSEVMEAFQDYCCTKHTEIRERYRFYSRNQLPDESFEEYLRVLNDLVHTCNFSDPKSMIADRIVMGINNEALRQTLLDISTLNFETVIHLCSAAEREMLENKEDANIARNKLNNKPNISEQMNCMLDFDNLCKNDNRHRNIVCNEHDKEIKDTCSADCDNVEVVEINRSVFQLGNNICLACCTAEDLNLGDDICCEFRKKYGGVHTLLDQKLKIGEMTILPYNDGYHLVIRKQSRDIGLVVKLFESLLNGSCIDIPNLDVKPASTSGSLSDNWDQIELSKLTPHATELQASQNITLHSNQIYDAIQDEHEKHDANFTFQDYEMNFQHLDIEDEDMYTIVKEIESDIFDVPSDYPLAICVAEDYCMSIGLEFAFRQQFKGMSRILAQKQKEGGVAFLEKDDRYIYYMVTKQESSKKTTLETMFRSMVRLAALIKEHGGTKLAIPRIGCGSRDGLKWSDVKNMLEYVFRGNNVRITVCNFKVVDCRGYLQMEPAMTFTHMFRDAVVIYIGYEDSHVDATLLALNTIYQFNAICHEYRMAKKTAGEFVRHNNISFSKGLCGCIVNQKHTQGINYEHFKNCVSTIRSTGYLASTLVAMRSVEDREDDLATTKLVNILCNTFLTNKILICQGKLFKNI